MPTYDYECTSCGHTFEVFQAMSDEPIKKCPECGKKVRRLIGGGVGIIFKGSGFYVTDNKIGSGKAAASAGDKKSEGDSTPGTGTETGTKEKGSEKKDSSSDKSDKKTKKSSKKTA